MDEYKKYIENPKYADRKIYSDTWIAGEIWKEFRTETITKNRKTKPKYKDAEAVRAIIKRQKKSHKPLIDK